MLLENRTLEYNDFKTEKFISLIEESEGARKGLRVQLASIFDSTVANTVVTQAVRHNRNGEHPYAFKFMTLKWHTSFQNFTCYWVELKFQ